MHPLAAHLLKVVAVGLAGLVGIVGIPILVFAFLLSGANQLCANSPILEVPSPNGKLKAVVFERDCGATTAFATHVSVIEAASSLPNEGGNLFVADTNHNAAPSGAGGGPSVQVAWFGPSALRIEHHPLARIVRAEPSAFGVKVRYVPPGSNS